MMRYCAVSIDLDEVHHYHRIHGLKEPDGKGAHLVYDCAFDRSLEIASELDLPLTFFVVASDLERPENVAAIQRARARHHEIGNHSKDHLYDLTRRSPEEQRDQVEGALAIFEQKLGLRPKGFRAPGYTVSDTLLDVVARAGHSYDSSVFPCPAYYTAKAAAFAALALRGRRSQAILDTVAVLGAPRRPYRIGRPYTRPGQGIWELPIQVTRGPRLPYIGTALMLAGKLGARLLTDLVLGEPLINLELHGIDLLDETDGLQPLRGYQPDLRVRVAEKRAILHAVVKRIRKAGYRFIRLEEYPSA